MNEISIKRSFTEPMANLLMEGINAWLGNDLNGFNDEAFEPIVCWEKALKEANEDEMQDLCDEISEIYVNLETFIVKSSIYNALLSAEYNWYWWSFKKSNKRLKRMQELEKLANKNGGAFKLIKWNELVNTIVNTFFKESVSLLMIRVNNPKYSFVRDLFDENNYLFFQSADEIDAFIRVFDTRRYFMSKTGEEEALLYGSLKNYELIFKKFYVLANLIEHLLENTMSNYEAEHSMDRLMNGIYAGQDDTLTFKLRCGKSRIDKSGMSFEFKRINSLLSDEIKTQRQIKFDIYNSVSKKIKAFEEETQEVTQKYQN